MLSEGKMAKKRRAKSLKRKNKAKETRSKKMSNTKGAAPVPSREEVAKAVLGLYEIQGNVQMGLTRLEKFCFGLIKQLIDAGVTSREDLDVYSRAILEYDNIDEFWGAAKDELFERAKLAEEREAKAVEELAALQESLNLTEGDAEGTGVQDAAQEVQGGATPAP